jgi:hypothetical protein
MNNSVENQCKNLEIGTELVALLQQNTNLSHTLCSKSIIDIIQHLNSHFPEFKNVTNSLIDTLQVQVSLFFI